MKKQNQMMIPMEVRWAYIVLCMSMLTMCSSDNPVLSAVSQIENNFSKKELDQFANKEEARALTDIHFEYALNFRNNELMSRKNIALIDYFNSRGIYDYDDMSNIVFKSLHRKLNNKEINLNKQVSEKRSIAINNEKCLKYRRTRLSINEKFTVGDTVQIRMKIDENDNKAYPVQCLDNYLDWQFDNQKDLLIKGVVLDKYTYDYIEENKFMKVRVIALNKRNIPSPLKIFSLGDEIEVVLNYDIIENVGNISNDEM